jgi:hypothetical protein
LFTNSAAIYSGGCGNNLIFPKCTKNEIIAIGQLLTTCPIGMQQAALDEIEGARQAGVIKTNLVPFARGIMMAIARGTFTVGHGPKVIEQRNRQNRRMTSDSSNQISQLLDTKALSKGKALLEKVNGLRTKIS